MGKKIEKLEIRIIGEKTVKEDILNLYSGLMELFDKINEIIEWIEEQEKTEKRREEPEEKKFAPYFDNDYRCPECQEELLVTCRHPLELYCTCCQKKIDLDEMEEELTFVKETLPNRKVKNNTEEWEEKLSELLLRYIDRDKDEKDIVNFIKQLLEENGKELFDDLVKKLTDSDY